MHKLFHDVWYAGVQVTVSYWLEGKRYICIMYEKEYTEEVQFSKHGHAVTWQKKILIRTSQCNSNTNG